MTTTTTAEGVDRIEPIHPGEVLVEDVIKGFGITQHRGALAIGVPPRSINETSMGQAHLGGYRSAARQVCRHNGAVLA